MIPVRFANDDMTKSVPIGVSLSVAPWLSAHPTASVTVIAPMPQAVARLGDRKIVPGSPDGCECQIHGLGHPGSTDRAIASAEPNV